MTIQDALKGKLTLEELHAIGKRMLADRREREQRAEEAARWRRQQSWTALVDAAQDRLGELAESLPDEPPDEFADDAAKAEILLRPWGAAAIAIEAQRLEAGRGWELRTEGATPYAVGTHFNLPVLSHLNEDDLATVLDGWIPEPAVVERVAHLAEAVALCWEAGAAYREAVANFCAAVGERRRLLASLRAKVEPQTSASLPAPAGPPAGDAPEPAAKGGE